MTAEDRIALTAALEHSRTLLLSTVNDISEDAWHLKDGDKWSVAEIMEHLWIIEYGVSKVVIPRLLSEPAAAGPGPSEDAALIAKTLDRSQKIAAPERVTPKDVSLPKDKAIARFADTRDKLKAFVESTEADLRVHHGIHPVFGMIDCCQWVLLVAAHTERHTAQIAQLKTT